MSTIQQETATVDVLSRYVESATRRELPDDVHEKGKEHLLDTLAAMVSGSRLHPGRAATAYARSQAGPPEATVVASDIATTATNAAQANGMLAHADETDDSHRASRMHPGCGVVAAALAAAEWRGRTGSEMLRAVVLGYDIGARSTMSFGGEGSYLTSRLATHSIGSLFGAGAAAGALAGFSLDELRWHWSWVAQQMSGLNCWMRDRDHVLKAFVFGGMAARNALAAATMVASGMSGIDDVFSGPGNYFEALDGDPAIMTAELGTRYEIMRADLKKWSVGSPAQAALDAVEAMLAQRPIDPGDVVSVEVRLHVQEAHIVAARSMPSISVQHLVALLLIDKTLTLESTHDDARMHDPEVAALRARVTLVPDPEIIARQAAVAIVLRDGSVLRRHIENVRGTWRNRMSRAEIEHKADSLMSPVLGAARSRSLIDAVWNIDACEDVRALRPLLAV